MSVTYKKTPGVYVNETFDLKVSIPNVATSVPAFFGISPIGGATEPQPRRISNMMEFVARFGAPASPTWTVTVQGDTFKIDNDPQDALPSGHELLYYAVKWYFLNGGGPCYIVAALAQDIDQYNSGLKALENIDEPTLIVPCGAIAFAADKYHGFCQSALSQAQSLRDRFCILDVRADSTARNGSQRIAADMAGFRDAIGNQNLSYGAAYYPYVQTAMNWEYKDDSITLHTGRPTNDDKLLSDDSNKPFHAKVTAWLRTLKVTLPPSAAVAGVYATVDKDRGVWKAPANVNLSYVARPLLAIDDSEQESMNVAGDKSSVNAIRWFSGKGTMVWGARTLDFQAADWTFISVRRLFIMMEESISKAIGAFVFESNDKATWTNVKASISSYLLQLWGQGALAGGKAEEAMEVRVGLGETMTQDDVREGRMIVEVRVAPVRPAEFIIITFSQNVKAA